MTEMDVEKQVDCVLDMWFGESLEGPENEVQHQRHLYNPLRRVALEAYRSGLRFGGSVDQGHMRHARKRAKAAIAAYLFKEACEAQTRARLAENALAQITLLAREARPAGFHQALARIEQIATRSRAAETSPRSSNRQLEKCPDCEKGLLKSAIGGGVKCDACAYWFCY